MFLNIPFISETLTILLLGEGFGVFFFGGGVLSFGASTDSKLQKISEWKHQLRNFQSTWTSYTFLSFTQTFQEFLTSQKSTYQQRFPSYPSKSSPWV